MYEQCPLHPMQVDVIFDDDTGFLSAVKTFMSTTKRPVILTTSGKYRAVLIDVNWRPWLDANMKRAMCGTAGTAGPGAVSLSPMYDIYSYGSSTPGAHFLFVCLICLAGMVSASLDYSDIR